MKLKDYLDEEGLIYGHFAKKIGVSYQTLYWIFKGRSVRLKTALRIEAATNGKVNFLDLMGDCPVKEAKENPSQLCLKFDALSQNDKGEISDNEKKDQGNDANT